ncbi:protein kinase domain-containing protein [Rhodococcus wratislaviensis]|uniref:Putative serine/threonine protein kinase n=1 Tax=Rhodococcus wratislaviensis NBRC 100605 TaxID=1219028 RepID=X0PPP0_RHOWR|nr:protein kinase [Rhodococcus wratislaviensis]GAF44724.1 putative serine/threonine protein kinase [Rhodococcus wratislaviensis NBRC 100605]
MGDPLQTQRVAAATVTAELTAAEFEDAHEIGRGGFGVVYRCTQVSLERTVAVKVLIAELDKENRARFFREQRAMGRLTGHPNIVNVLQVGATESGHPYLVMQYHPQGSLEARIRRHGPLALEDALRLGVKMAGALETAHQLGILHRDVKPGNILLTDYGEPALSDFGIAHISGGFQTTTGTITGSPAFTAPEVLGGDPPSPASDIYGLGATLFCTLTGHAAFERRSGEQVVAQFLRITTQPVPDLREDGIADDACAVIEKAMARDPDDRPSAAALGDELRRIQLRHGFPIDDMALRADQGGERRSLQPVSRGRRPTPAPAVRGTRGNLPLELTSFVGRRHELSEAKNLLSGSRLVTLTGIGGVGKTRLALRVAANAQRDHADGVWLVELGELRDDSLLVEAVAAALGVQDHSGRPLHEILAEFLSTRELMLVLDNCEQVVDAVAEVAETLLRACPGLRILATSREPIGIGGESVLRVPPLTVPDLDLEPSLRGLPKYDAVTLFAERAAAAVPGYALTEHNRVTVARICARLDGLPLAIELAAARLPALSPEQILQRLTDRFDLLTRGSRGAPTRQQTLRCSIDWSYDLCTADEQRLWGRLSVFAGSFELDAAEDICGRDLAPGDLLDSVTALMDKSILIREESDTVVRFRLLETLHEYGREQIQQTGEYPELRRRHRDWYQRLALDAEAGWISPRQLDWIARLAREQPNLRQALEFCVSEDNEAGAEAGLRLAAALYPFWNSRGLYSEGRRWLDRFLTRHTGQPAVERVKALFAASVLAEIQGDLRSATALVEEGHRLAEQATDPVTHALADYADGILALCSDDLDRACHRLESALEGFGTHGDRLLQTGALNMLGLAYDMRGETGRAIRCHEHVLSITGACGESTYRSYALWAMGVAVWRQGDPDHAVELLEEALRLTRQANNPRTTASCLQALAWIAGQERKAQRAAVLMGAAEELGHAVGSVTVVFPHLRSYHAECEQVSRRVLGDRAFDAARQDGRTLDLDAAIVYALGEQAPSTAPAAGPSAVLTKRERQVADLVADGLTNKAIAAKLVISQRTAQGHVEHILAKLGFTSRTQIAAWVVEQGRNGRA